MFYTLNGDLVNQWWDSGIGQWIRQSWSVNATGKPAVTMRNGGSDVGVFYRTRSGGISEMYMSGGVWDGPINLVGSEVSSDPAVAARDSNHQEVVWVDMYGALKHRGWDYGSGGWLGIGTIMAADVISHPTLTARRPDTMDGFVVKNNQNVVHFSWGPAGWTWEDWASGALGSPSAFNLNDGATDAVFHKSNGYIADRYWDWRYGWAYKDWPAMVATDPAATALNGVGYAVYGEVGGNLVVRNLSSGASNTVFNGINKAYTPSITTRDGGLEVTFWASDGSLKHLRLDPGNLAATVAETITQQA